MPTGAALTTTSNTFAASQTIKGNLVLIGTGAAIQFADGTTQTTAATGALSGVPSGFMITGPTPTAPAGYTLVGSFTMNQWLSKSPSLNQIKSSSAVTINNKIYVVDAIDDSLNVLNQVYDPSTDTWNNFLEFGEHTGTGAAVAVNGVIYRMGGQTLTQGIIGTVDAYDSNTNTASTKKPMPVPETGFAAVTVNNLIYAIGGVGLVGGVEQLTGHDPGLRSFYGCLESHNAAAAEAHAYEEDEFRRRRCKWLGLCAWRRGRTRKQRCFPQCSGGL